MDTPTWIPQPTLCPKCGRREGVLILRGYPTTEAEEAAHRGELELGGCLIGEDDPDRRCRSCGHTWTFVPERVSWSEDPAQPSAGLMVTASLTGSGQLRIAGQDLSPAVGHFFGDEFDEYEYWISIRGENTPLLLDRYGYPPETPLLQIFRDDPTRLRDMTQFLREHDIPYDFDSHLGH